jgi:hypothetical protein
MAALLIDGVPAGKLGDKMLDLYTQRFGEGEARLVEQPVANALT